MHISEVFPRVPLNPIAELADIPAAKRAVFVDRLRQLLDVTEEQYYLMAPTPRVSVAAKKVRAAYNAVQALTQPG